MAVATASINEANGFELRQDISALVGRVNTMQSGLAVVEGLVVPDNHFTTTPEQILGHWDTLSLAVGRRAVRGNKRHELLDAFHEAPKEGVGLLRQIVGRWTGSEEDTITQDWHTTWVRTERYERREKQASLDHDYDLSPTKHEGAILKVTAQARGTIDLVDSRGGFNERHTIHDVLGKQTGRFADGYNPVRLLAGEKARG